MSSSQGNDRALLWRKLFSFDHAPSEGTSIDSELTPDLLRAVMKAAVARGRQEPLRQMLLQRLRYWLRSDVVPPFWRFFDILLAETRHLKNKTKRSRRHVAVLCTQQLTQALQFADEAFALCVEIARLFDDHVPLEQRSTRSMLQELRTSLRCVMFEDSRAVERFEELLFMFFSLAFAKSREAVQGRLLHATSVRQTLQQLEWLHMAEPALLRVLQAQVRKKVTATYSDVYDELLLAPLEQWASAELLPWL